MNTALPRLGTGRADDVWLRVALGSRISTTARRSAPEDIVGWSSVAPRTSRSYGLLRRLASRGSTARRWTFTSSGPNPIGLGARRPTCASSTKASCEKSKRPSRSTSRTGGWSPTARRSGTGTRPAPTHRTDMRTLVEESGWSGSKDKRVDGGVDEVICTRPSRTTRPASRRLAAFDLMTIRRRRTCRASNGTPVRMIKGSSGASCSSASTGAATNC